MKKLLKVVLVLMLAFGIQIATLSNVDAAQVSDLPDGKYTIPTKLKNASNIANDSMAAGALAENGELSVEEGKWDLTAEFKTLNVMQEISNIMKLIQNQKNMLLKLLVIAKMIKESNK